MAAKFKVLIFLGISCAIKATELKSCSSVKSEYKRQGFKDEVPNYLISGEKLKFCKVGPSLTKVQDWSCCTPAMEHKLSVQSRFDFDDRLKKILIPFAQTLDKKQKKIDDNFGSLVNSSQNNFEHIFEKTYGIVYLQNSYIFTDLFSTIRQYYNHGQLDLEHELNKFFTKLFLKLFTVYNTQYIFSDVYLNCVQDLMPKLKPFGDESQKLITNLKRSLVALKAFVEGLSTSASVVKDIVKVNPSVSCVSELMRMRHCSTCAGILGIRTCQPYCLHVQELCLEQHSLLDPIWKEFTSSMFKLGERLEGPFNVGHVLSPIEIKISNAVMNFQESGQQISTQVFQSCGQPHLGRVSRSVESNGNMQDKHKILNGFNSDAKNDKLPDNSTPATKNGRIADNSTPAAENDKLSDSFAQTDIKDLENTHDKTDLILNEVFNGKSEIYSNSFHNFSRDNLKLPDIQMKLVQNESKLPEIDPELPENDKKLLEIDQKLRKKEAKFDTRDVRSAKYRENEGELHLESLDFDSKKSGDDSSDSSRRKHEILTKLIREVTGKLRNSETFWSDLDEEMCKDAQNMNVNCWNGREVASYTGQSLSEGVAGKNQMLTYQMNLLESLTGKVNDAYQGNDVSWVVKEKPTQPPAPASPDDFGPLDDGSGSGDYESKGGYYGGPHGVYPPDDEDGYNPYEEGSGEGSGYEGNDVNKPYDPYNPNKGYNPYDNTPAFIPKRPPGANPPEKSSKNTLALVWAIAVYLIPAVVTFLASVG